MFKSTPHAHTTYVDGKSSPREMLDAAVAKGFRSLGFSEHAIQPNEPIYGLTPESEPRYIAEITALADEYADRIRVRLGTERDVLSTADRSKYEYVIGSVHYVSNGEGPFFTVDGPADMVREGIEAYFAGDSLAYIRAYYETLASYISEYKPDIIGHFDLPRKWNARLCLFDGTDARYRKLALGALERMIRVGAFLEVNTGAIARGAMNDPYPELFLLSSWREMGGRAIIGTDCHLAQKLDCGLDIARELCLNAGYRSVWALGEHDALFEEFAL